MSLLTNLVSYYKMEGNSNDSVGSNNGTDSSISYSNSYGKINQGASFSGILSKINFGNVMGSTFTSAHTINMWVKPTSFSTAIGLLAKTDLNIPNPIDTAINNTNNIIYYLGNGTATINNINTTSAGLSLDTYYMITFVYSGSGGYTGMSIYLNGSTATTTGNTNGSISDSSNNLMLGQRSDNTRNSNAQIDEVGVWSRALSGTEVSELYNSGTGLSYPFTNNNSAMFAFF